MPKCSRTQCSHQAGYWGHLFCWQLCIKIQFSIYWSRWQTSNWPINTCCIRSTCPGHVRYSLAILWSAQLCEFERQIGVRRGSDSTGGKRKRCYSNSRRQGKRLASVCLLSYFTPLYGLTLLCWFNTGSSEPWTSLPGLISDPTTRNGNI